MTIAYEFVITGRMDLIDELKSLRVARNLSQSDVAVACGVDQSAVSLWEKRKTVPSGPARILLARYIADTLANSAGEAA